MRTSKRVDDLLPRLPVPRLEESCERFIAWCAPLLSWDELAAAKNAVSSFLRPDSPARKLQAALEAYDDRNDVQSWLDAFWSTRYLGRRDRIALNANYFYLFKSSGQGQIERAAELVSAAAEDKLLLDAARIPPVIERGHALSMEQNRFLFSTTRIPGRAHDTIRAPYSVGWPGPSRERHIVVFFRGNMFRMDVMRADGQPFTFEELAAGLRALMADAGAEDRRTVPVGHLTTKSRAGWANSRRALINVHPRNAEMLEAVETALFCLCLEETAPKDAREACDHLLHGDSGNRWFDKSISLIVFKDGTAGINVEHSQLDGSTIINFIDRLLERSVEDLPRCSPTQGHCVPPFEAIEFEVDADLWADVAGAGEAFAAFAANVATAVLSLRELSAARAKQLQVSPDAFAQMAFQVAHKRARGFVGATYESVGMRHFSHGRTEAMRVVTPEVLRFVHVMDDPDADDSTRRTAFWAAIEAHVKRAKECKEGRAPEQHLWELQLMQQRHGKELGVGEPLAFYNNTGWSTMRDDYLSTSSTASANIQYGGFGPTSDQCIGIWYMLVADRFNLYLSAPRPLANEMVQFSEALRQAIPELRDLLSSESR